MTREDLKRCDMELTAIVPHAPVDARATEELRIFNENVRAVRRTLLEPAREQLEGTGVIEPDLATRLSRAVGVMGPWRRALREAYLSAVDVHDAEGEGRVMVEEARRTVGEIVIRPEGVFDALAAWSVRGRLAQLPAEANVVLDFSRVRDFSDLGVGVIASGLASMRARRVRVRGLLLHQHRLFRYFGVDVGMLHATGGGDG